jgi:DNA-binding PadR family transcriptional regulator
VSREHRITEQSERILALLASSAAIEFCGADIERATKIAKGTIYPTLARMSKRRWLSWRWEQIDPQAQGRPRKRLYKLTGEGEAAASRIANEAARRESERQYRRARKQLKASPEWSI